MSSNEKEDCCIESLLEQLLEKYDHETEEEHHQHLHNFCAKRTKEEARKVILEIAELILDDPIECEKLADAIIASGHLDDVLKKE